jgi:hypothetical protein
MKKIVLILVSLFAVLFGACSQIPGLTPTPGTVSSPTINPSRQPIPDRGRPNIDGSSDDSFWSRNRYA